MESSAISPMYSGAQTHTPPVAIPANILALYIIPMEFAKIISSHDKINGSASPANVSFLPTVSARYLKNIHIGVNSKYCSIGNRGRHGQFTLRGMLPSKHRSPKASPPTFLHRLLHPPPMGMLSSLRAWAAPATSTTNKCPPRKLRE